jgi:hypothetical protein
MDRPFRITAAMLFASITFLMAGELAAGTDPEFVAMMAGTMTCIAVTFNLLGGFRTISGIAFTGFALCTIVISQFAKVLFFEAADKNLEAPYLTIKVYLVFYFCVMVGVFVYGRLRINLLKPMEPESGAQIELQYAVSLVVGLIASGIFAYYDAAAVSGGEEAGGHSVGVALAALPLFSLVLAVLNTIRETGGRHSFGIRAFHPLAGDGSARVISNLSGFNPAPKSHLPGDLPYERLSPEKKALHCRHRGPDRVCRFHLAA